MRTGASARPTAARKSVTNCDNCSGAAQFRAKTINPSGLLARKKSCSAASSRGPAQPKITARGIWIGVGEWDSVGDNEAADVHGFQLPANIVGFAARSERPNPHAVPDAFVTKIDAYHNDAHRAH